MTTTIVAAQAGPLPGRPPVAPTARSTVAGISASVTVNTNTFATRGVNALAISRSAPTAPSSATNTPAAIRPPVIAPRLCWPSAVTTVIAARYAAAGPSYIGSRKPKATWSSVATPRASNEALISVPTCACATPASEPATSQKPIAAGTTATIHNSAATVSRRQDSGRREGVDVPARGTPRRRGATCGGAVRAVTIEGGPGTGNPRQRCRDYCTVHPYAIAYG